MHVLVTLSHVPGVQYIQRTSPARNDINVYKTEKRNCKDMYEIYLYYIFCLTECNVNY